jgi:NAD-dependent dihydropyrimidine dehydrogenase PreA subunit
MNVVHIGISIVLLLWFSGSMWHRYKNRHKVIYVDKNNCTGCQLCVKKCSRKVLEVVKDETGVHAIVKYPDKCDACEHCLLKCKFNALKLIKKTDKYKTSRNN